MICKNCNAEVADNAAFCHQCGNAIEKKKDNKGTVIAILLCCAAILGLLIFVFTPTEPTNNRSRTSKSKEEAESAETINFDLTQYKEHGQLSCGRVWVIKEFSDWDEESEDYFAYLDVNGNITSRWFSLNRYNSPRDFSNGYVIVSERETFEEIYDYCNFMVFDTDFNVIASLNCRNSFGLYVTDFDSQGYAYALGYDHEKEDDILYWIDENGAHAFEESRYGYGLLYEYVLESIKVSNNYFVAVCGSGDSNYLYTDIACIYDMNGKLVLDIAEALHEYTNEFAVVSADVVAENCVRFYFYGTNTKRYVCTMDFGGNFIESPKEA